MKIDAALVLQGGAMRSMFTTGVLDAFLEEGLIFPYIVGVSAGAANGIAFLSRETGRTCRVNLTYINDPRFMGLKNFRKTGSFFNFDFLYDEMPHHLDPFNYDALFASEEELEIGATNCESGEVDYFSFQEAKKGNDFKTFLHALYASCSMPCVCKPVYLNGVPYLDGGIGTPIPTERAWEQGYENQVVILTQSAQPITRSRIRTLPPRWAYRKSYPSIVSLCNHYDELFNETMDTLLAGEAKGRFTLIAPDQDYGVRVTERNRNKLIRLYFHGFNKGLAAAKQMKAEK